MKTTKSGQDLVLGPMQAPRLVVALLVIASSDSLVLMSKKVQQHRIRLSSFVTLPCTARNEVRVQDALWLDVRARGRLRKGSVSSASGHLRFDDVSRDLSGLYECMGLVRTPKREIFVKTRHDVQDVCRPGTFSPGASFRTCIPCEYNTYAPHHGSAFCFWCPPGTSTYKQQADSLKDCEGM
ncbi:unnamed protein product, partial [Ixodes persulcatus]